MTHNACRNDERLRSLFERVARRRGENKATVAVAREMLVIAYHMLKRKEPYRGVDDVLSRSKLKRKKGREWLRSLNLPSIDQTILEVDLQRLEELEAHIDAFTDKIAQEAVENPQAKLLMSFTGVDYYSAMLLASEIGDVTRFPSAKKLVSCAGLAPSTRQSADKTIHGHIVREGNKRIRWILVEAAQHASRHDPRLRGFYLRIIKRRGYQRAIVARNQGSENFHWCGRRDSDPGRWLSSDGRMEGQWTLCYVLDQVIRIFSSFLDDRMP